MLSTEDVQHFDNKQKREGETLTKGTCTCEMTRYEMQCDM